MEYFPNAPDPITDLERTVLSQLQALVREVLSIAYVFKAFPTFSTFPGEGDHRVPRLRRSAKRSRLPAEPAVNEIPCKAAVDAVASPSQQAPHLRHLP